MSIDIKKVTFWPAQKEFFEWGPSPIFFFGGIGSGKTFIGCLKILYLLDQYPGSRAAIVRQRSKQLKRTILPTVSKLLPPLSVARRNDNEGSIVLRNRSELIFQHLDKESSIDDLKSLEINFAYVDQGEDISALAWDTLIERLGRWSGATKRGGWPADWPHKNRLGENIPPRYALISGYSPGYDHWLTDRFWEFGGDRKEYKEKGYRVVRGSSRTNLALSDEYIKDLLARGDEFTKRYVDAADWGAHEGRIFDLTPRSILEPTAGLLFKIKNTMRLHRVYDHGEAVPSAYMWYATDSEGNVYFYRESGGADMLVSEHRTAIYELSKQDGTDGVPPHYYSNIADPAIFAKTRGRSVNSAPTWSVSDEFRDQKIMDPKTAIYWKPANNDEAMTINRVREYLKPDPTHRHPLTGKLGSPRVFFVRKTDEYPYGCHEVLVDIRAARRKEVGVMPNGTKLFSDERDDTVRDHWLDCLAPGTRVLTSDLRWVRIETLNVGDLLVGFDEETGGQYNPRRWSQSLIESVDEVTKPSYRLTLSDGTSVVCSYDHQWLTTTKDGKPSNRSWVRTEHLDGGGHFDIGRPRGIPSGDRLILKPLNVWDEPRSWQAGYLAGVFDGEGHLSVHYEGRGSWASLGFCQKENACLKMALDCMDSVGFRYSKCSSARNGVHAIRLLGGATEQLRFLGSIRPARLLAKAKIGGRFQCEQAFGVVDAEFLGNTKLISLQTSTRTFIAEGLASHNCTRYALGLRPALARQIHVEEDEPNAIKIHDYFEAMDASWKPERSHNRY